MSMRLVPRLLAIGTLVLMVAPSAAAQNEPTPLPPGVIARVGEKDITKRAFDKWFKSAARAAHGPGAVFDPPAYDGCIAREMRVLSKKGKAAPPRDALLAQCKARQDGLTKQVVQFLVQAQWIEQVAVEMKLQVTPKQVRRKFKAQKRQAFRTEKAFRRFLRESGTSRAQIRYRIRLDMLQGRITKRVLANGSLPQFIEKFRSTSKAKTTCLEGYAVDECGTTVPAS